jgi:hypothetical protein
MSDVAEVGVRHAFILEKREGRRKTPAGLGFAAVNYGNLFVRDRWTLFAIARELDCKIEDILSPPETRNGPRWSELITASEAILETVRSLPAHLKTLVVMRGEGVSWRKIQQEFPGRTTFSMREDHATGLRRVARDTYEHLNFLASFDKFIVVRSREAA